MRLMTKLGRVKAEIEEARAYPPDGDTDFLLHCEECGHETVVVPDPKPQYREKNQAHCWNCDTVYYAAICEHCNEGIISDRPFDENHLSFHPDCWNEKMKAE